MAKVCLNCGKPLTKLRSKFCSNKGRGNCKDRYHNRLNPRGIGLDRMRAFEEAERNGQILFHAYDDYDGEF